jgi:hypothetical protein
LSTNLLRVPNGALARERLGRMAGARYVDVTLGAVVLGGQVGFRMAVGPWWAGFLLAVLGLAAAGVRIVFPQDSSDKLAWWRERWRTRRPRGASGRHRTRREGRE